MKKIMLALLVLPFLASAAHATSKMPAAVRASLESKLKASSDYKNADKPTFKQQVYTVNGQKTASLTLRGLGTEGPIPVGGAKVQRLNLLQATVPFNAKTGKDDGKIQVSGFARPL